MVNQQAEAMFGYGAEELVGRSVEQLLPDRFRTGHAEFRRRFLSAPIPRPMGQGRELFAKRKDGAEFPVEIALSPVSTFAGKTVLASIVDISERKASHRLLQVRAKQQAAVADLGQFALEVSDLDQVMNQAVARMSETLEVEFCKILELDGKQLKLRAGVGWRDGLVGSAIVGTELTSQAGFTLMCHAPVIVADLRSEPRFSGPALLTDHGVVSGMSCIIAGTPDSPFGILGVHTAQKRSFSEDDVHFLESIANVVAQSVQRFYAETELRRSVEQLRRSRDTFLNLIQNNPFGVYLVDSNFRLAQVSAGSQKVFGNVHPLIGRDFPEVLRMIWPEPFASHALERFGHTLATGEPYHSRDTMMHRSDTAEVESYDWKIERVTLPDGQPGVVCYFYDMTERVRYEQEIHRLKDDLEV
jgi:PAS domain S-box-containing protein